MKIVNLILKMIGRSRQKFESYKRLSVAISVLGVWIVTMQ